MPLIRYFWLIAAGVMLINILIWRGRLAPLVQQGTITAEEAASFLRGALIWMVGSCVLLGLIALYAGWSDPFCAGMLAFDTPPRVASSLVIVTAWCAMLWWVWMGRGADVLGRIAPALGRGYGSKRAFSPDMIRFAVTAGIVVAVVVGFNGRRTIRTEVYKCVASDSPTATGR